MSKILTSRQPLQAVPRPVKTYHTSTYDRIALEKTGFNGSGKTVLVTGGATGVGFSIATAFAKAGVKRIVIISRSLGPLEEAKASLRSAYPNVEITTYSASVTDYKRITDILHEIESIDILVLSATAVNEAIPTHSIPSSAVEDVFATNVIGSFNILKTYSDLEFDRTKTIINVSSAAAGMCFPYNSIYGASKAALAHIIQHMFAEQAGKPLHERIRMYTFHPGMYYTPLVSKHTSEDWVEWEDIQLPGDFAVWLAGPQSGFLQGRFLWAAWDVDELFALKERIQQDPTFLTLGLIL